MAVLFIAFKLTLHSTHVKGFFLSPQNDDLSLYIVVRVCSLILRGVQKKRLLSLKCICCLIYE